MCILLMGVVFSLLKFIQLFHMHRWSPSQQPLIHKYIFFCVTGWGECVTDEPLELLGFQWWFALINKYINIFNMTYRVMQKIQNIKRNNKKNKQTAKTVSSLLWWNHCSLLFHLQHFFKITIKFFFCLFSLPHALMLKNRRQR